jgi:serine/threonine protein phosphatase 1
VPWFETETHLFTHGNYDPDLPLDQQDGRTLRWLSLRDSVPGPHRSGKIAVVGHTPQSEVLNLGHLICLDTGCAYGGKLTGMDVDSGKVWQAEE